MTRLGFIDEELESLRRRSLYRETLCVEGAQGRTIRVDDNELLCFCSNDYLGLSTDPRVRRAAAEAAEAFGTGATASRLINGTMRPHEALERRLARFKNAEAALVFPTGYMANLGTIAALVGKGDVVYADRLCHASLIDGCRLSGASFRVFPHCDAQALERALRRGVRARRRLIVTDGVFSMDGDLAPLPALAEVASRYEAILLVDDAHGTGVLGATGRGTAQHLSAEDGIDVAIGTLSKALGSLGGFVTGSARLIDYLIQRARTFIYTTASPPSALAAALAALEIAEKEPARRVRLLRLARTLRQKLISLGLNVPEGETPIIPVIIGDSARALRMSQFLRREGFLVPAIRPPAVPPGTARLRISVQASHTDNDIARLANAFRAWQEGHFEPDG